MTVRQLVSLLFARVPRRAAERPPPSAAPQPGKTAQEPAEINDVAGAFSSMLGELRGSTERLQDLVFKLGSLNEALELAAKVPRIQDLLGLVLETTMRAVDATIGSIMILDPGTHMLRVAASRGIPEEIVARAEVKVGEGIAGKVVELGEAVLVDDVETDPRFQKPNAPRYASGSFICMPIRAGDRVIGVLNMAKRPGELQPQARRADAAIGPSRARPGERQPQARPFSSIDLQFLKALMTYIGYAVDNARLLEGAQHSANQLEVVIDDLRLTQERLVQGETLRTMGQLAAGMAHHLNNLFAVIVGRTELLLASPDTAAVRGSLEVVRRAAKDGAEIARRIQRFSRRQPASESVAVDLNMLAREAVELTRSRLGAGAAAEERRIEFAVDAAALPAIGADPAQLRELLMNLLQNAMEAMPGGGEVVVTTRLTGDGIECAVADTGIGMSEEVRHRAVEPFFTTKGPKSTGLGLSIAYGIVQRHGGRLEIERAPGGGTTVSFRLPIAPGAPIDEVERAPCPSLRVLLIGAETRSRESLGAALETQGHRVVHADDGRIGIGLLRAGEPFDLALLDLGSSPAGARDVIAAIRATWPRLALGVVSEAGHVPGEQRAQLDMVVDASAGPDALDAALAELCRSRRALHVR